MNWLAQNWDFLLLVLFFGAFVNRGWIMARVMGIPSISVHDLAKRLDSPSPPVLLDVRTPMEFNAGHAPKAIPAPLNELSRRIAHLKQSYPGREIALICRSGNRSLMGAITLKRAGLSVCNVSGGMAHWAGQGYPVRQ